MRNCVYISDELKHWGILGMHWGVRRYQNEDGTLTPEGRERYGVKTSEETRRASYSKKYETLKNKKNRSNKEEKYLQVLEKGKNTLKIELLIQQKISLLIYFLKNFGLNELQHNVILKRPIMVKELKVLPNY